MNYPKQGTKVASGGTASITIPAIHGIIRQILVKPSVSSTTFDLKLTDIYSMEVFEDTNLTGLFNHFTEIPCYGNWTLTISNSSVLAETFTYLVVIQEF